MELHARQTLLAEGCRGSCSEEVMKKFNLRENADPQTYGLGLKEVATNLHQGDIIFNGKLRNVLFFLSL